jgi:predicted esterase YcpF (UPF0227 family)
MKILYIHGFGSCYNPTHEKIKSLETLGTIVGVNVDYCKGFTSVYDAAMDVAVKENVDLIVGTSMGGYLASHIAAGMQGTPFVALNPATSPSVGLQHWVGTFTDYTGKSKCLTELIISSYPDIIKEGSGLVIVESGDEVISANETRALLDDVFRVEMISGGSHRFSHMDTALVMIKEHMQNKHVAIDAQL